MKTYIKMILVIVLAVGIGVAGYLFFTKSQSDVRPSDKKVYTNTYEGFSFEYPKGFELSQHDYQSERGSEVFFTNYGEPDVSGLPPSDKAHIAYGAWQDKNGSDYKNHIASRSPYISKAETMLIGLSATRIVTESPKLSDSSKIEREISYFLHENGKSHQFFLEYFKDDPNGANYEKSFEAMIKTVKKL